MPDGYTEIVSCVASHPAVTGCRIEGRDLIIEVMPLPGRAMPDTVTVWVR